MTAGELTKAQFDAGADVVFAAAGGSGLGVLQARRRGSAIDRWLTRASLAGYAMPSFWLGIVLVAFLSLRWRLFPAAQMTDPNGPCGAAGCFTAGQASGCSGGTLTRNRTVIGQLVGASAYDIGHIIFGLPGGGVAQLRSVGGDGKARGCTGLPAPVGDFFAVDYVAHEMGHQFGGNHTFNGNQWNCSGGNRNAANSVEPGSGSSIMAYAGICRHDNLQPHTDPYWSQRSYEEITTFVTSTPGPINEVQTVSLREFDADGDSFRLALGGGETIDIVRGSNYTTAAIAAALEAILPAGSTV